MDMTNIIAQVPINAYVVIGCCTVGWLMKKFLPTDNRIIPAALTVLGAVIFVLLEGATVEHVIAGAFNGAAATGLHQIFKQFVEGRGLAKTNGDGSLAEDAETEAVDDYEEV